MVREIKLGSSWQTDTRYHLEPHLQNILFRKNHPCPTSRLNEAWQLYNVYTDEFPSGYEELWGQTAELWSGLSELYGEVWNYGRNIVADLGEKTCVDRSWKSSEANIFNALGLDSIDDCIY